jgi:hypothetical protein
MFLASVSPMPIGGMALSGSKAWGSAIQATRFSGVLGGRPPM